MSFKCLFILSKKKMNDLKELFKSKYFSKILVFIGLAGMLLIAFPTGKAEKNNAAYEAFKSDEYIEASEKKLSSILSQMDGVGKVKVMITLKSSEEIVYAQNEKISTDYTGNPVGNGEGDKKESVRKEKSYVFSDYGSDRSALKISSTEPSVKGVIVVCEGGGSSIVRSRITEACSTILGIKYGNVFVAKLN